MEMSSELTIGEVAKRAGVATSQIRSHERIGMLPAPARLSGRDPRM
jgi:DNA-binding transcriptional MerR regulator